MLHHKCIHGAGIISMRWENKSKPLPPHLPRPPAKTSYNLEVI